MHLGLFVCLSGSITQKLSFRLTQFSYRRSIISVARPSSKAGHRSTLAFLRFCVIAATGIRKHTQVELLWITRRIRRISAFPINSERLDASVFTSTLPATKRNSRTISTRATDVIFERKHCSRRRRHTQVDMSSAHKQLGNSRTITRNRWHGATISERKVDLWPA